MNKNTAQAIWWMNSNGKLRDPNGKEPHTSVDEHCGTGRARIVQIVARPTTPDNEWEYPYLVLVEYDL